jgi:nicotinamide mononucleotide transporter
VGLFGAFLTFVVFLHARLYAATALQVVYMALMVYGWHEWRHGGEKGRELAVSGTPRRWALVLAAGGVAFAVGLGVFLRYRTDAALPFWDAGTTSFSLVAQFMTTRKWIESWLVWIAVDVVYAGMLISQGLHLMAALYAGYLVLAVLGFAKWRRSMAVATRREAA